MAAAAVVVAAAAVTESSLGAGWRPELHTEIAAHQDIGFIEVMAESVVGGIPEALAQLVRSPMTSFVHGVSLSLGSAERPSAAWLQSLQDIAEGLSAEMVSEHVSFTRAGNRFGGHLLPLPRTNEVLDVLVENYAIAQDQLNVPLALENIAAFLEWPDSTHTEVDFLNELLYRTGAPLLLDVANLYANATNNRFDPFAALDRLNLEKLAYVHVAGGLVRDDIYHDTHRHNVVDEVWDVLRYALQLKPDARCMIERDGDYDPNVFRREMNHLSDRLSVKI